ncbi:MAG: hypothetical protein K2W88_07140 [Pararheinheimera sp.]|nr:hypothetical protein [Rheinheimera sp.]
MSTLLIIQTMKRKQQGDSFMFRQSLIQVFKGLAEFHGYVPVAPAAHTESDKTVTAGQVKQLVVLPPKQSATVRCC